MKTHMKILVMMVSFLILSGCSTTFKERKAPCPPTASLSTNPCNPLPVNVAQYSNTAKDMHS